MKIEIDRYYGLVVGVVALSQILVIALGIKVGIARKKYGVKLPAMYDENKPAFNCYQRVHQNTLELYPMFFVNMLIGGLAHPLLTSAIGLVWIITRVIYAKGYYTGVPDNRMTGVALGFPALFGLLFCSLSFAVQVFFH